MNHFNHGRKNIKKGREFITNASPFEFILIELLHNYLNNNLGSLVLKQCDQAGIYPLFIINAVKKLDDWYYEDD